MEYDKSLSNTNKERDIDTEQDMREINQDINCGEETIRLILQFPDEEQDTTLMQKEVKAILIAELQKQIKNFYLSERREWLFGV